MNISPIKTVKKPRPFTCMSARIVKCVALLGVFHLLLGCIPTVTEVYEAPLVYGQLLDENGLKPIVGAKLQHQHLDAQPVYTDDQGYFELPSISSYQAVVLMPAHAFNAYGYRVTIGDQEFSLKARGSLRMLNEEIVYAPLMLDGSGVNEGFSALLPQDTYNGVMRVFRESAVHFVCDSQKLKAGLLEVAQQQLRPENLRDSSIYRNARKQWNLCSRALSDTPLDRDDQRMIDEYTRVLVQWQ